MSASGFTVYAYSNPTVYIDPDGNAALLASGAEFDEYGAQLYQQGNKVGAAGVAVAGAFYKVGTGFFTLGLFDEANQAITDNDTAKGAAKQFGNSVANTAKDVAREYAQEGAVTAAVTVGSKVACGRWKQACKTAVDVGKKVSKKVGDKLNSDIIKSKKKTGPSLTKEKTNLGDGNSQKTTDTGNGAGCPCCFAGGTPVLTFDGLKAIESIQIGELVASRNEDSGDVEWKPVTALFVNDDNRLTYELTLIDEDGISEKYEVTDNHPFFVEGAGWVETIDLTAGMHIPAYDGGHLFVGGLVGLDRSPITYNFEVDDFHTYYVGELGAWVHNECTCGNSIYIPREKSASGRPILQLDAQQYPNHTKLLDDAVEEGHSLSKQNKVPSRQADKNRYHSQKEIRKERGGPDEGFDYDEYPYASTKQGGAGAKVRQVDSVENQAAGRDLGAFYKKAKVKDDDEFDIEIINRSE